MKKGLINPVLHTIRSANQPSTRYSMPIPQNTYTQSIENMAGSGYNKNSKKLRTLYDDAKGIAIGARPNPETNEKRFWGLYGQQANTKPYQAVAEENNYMRQNIDGLRYGNTNRRFAKNANIKKESYYNTLGGGYDPDIVVQPKKGRPYKGQPDSLPLIAKREKRYSPDGEKKVFDRITQNFRDQYAYYPDGNGGFVPNEEDFPYSKYGRHVEQFGYSTPQTTVGGTFKKPIKRNLSAKETQDLAMMPIWNSIPEYEKNAFVPQYTKLPKVGLKAPRAWYDPRKYRNPTAAGKAASELLTTPSAVYTVGASLSPAVQQGLARAGKAGLQGALNIAETYAPKIFDQAALAGKKALEYAGYSDKIAPYLKNPKVKSAIEYASRNIQKPAKIAAKTVGATDLAALTSSWAWNNLAEGTENVYNYPTTIDYKNYNPNTPLVVSEKTGEAANRKSGNIVNFLNLLGELTSASQIINTLPAYITDNVKNRYDTPSKQKARTAFELSRRGNEGAVSPYMPLSDSAKKEKAKIAERLGPPKLSPDPKNTQEPQFLNWLDQNSVLGDASEFEGRKRLSAKFSDLPLREQQEYARFGKPIETRIKPSKIRAAAEGVAGAYTGQMFIPGSFNQNINDDAGKTLDYWFLDQGAHRGMAQGPLTEVYGYDTEGNLKAKRVSRPLTDSQNAPGKNMAPFLNLPGATRKWESGKTTDENLYGKYLRENYGEDYYGNYIPKIISETDDPYDAFVNDKSLKSGYYDSYNPDMMYGVQLTPSIENLSPTYIPETEQETRAQQAKRFALNAQTNPLNLNFGKRMKKSLASVTNAKNNNVVGGLHAKSLAKSMLKNKTLSPSSHTSLKHSNKYAK
jgi:hypothetical protein